MNPYFCENCCARYEVAGDCETCTEEALLDLREADTIELLENFDNSRYRKKTGMFSLVLGFVLLPVLVLWPYTGFKFFIALYALGIFFGTAFLAKKFPPLKKCPPEAQRNFPEN